MVTVITKPARERDRNHLRLVAGQPCLVCGRTPCDPHHIKFAEQRAMGRKVSDRFSVPLCRLRHRELYRRGNERSWCRSMRSIRWPLPKGFGPRPMPPTKPKQAGSLNQSPLTQSAKGGLATELASLLLKMTKPTQFSVLRQNELAPA
jgi:hypothetical protein